ncbi:MAG TPA: methyltransferase, partial [Candidatus Limnocylindrales bacterium]|nr:methyltransferase [Candidatus Limnocylindrales bacterium]
MNFSELMSLASGHAEARIVHTAVELKIFDALSDSPKSAKLLARESNLDPPATELLLNALTALKLIHKKADEFSLAKIAEQYLITSAPQYVGGMIRFDASLWSCWEKLEQALRTGKSVRPVNMYQDVAAETKTFINGMDSLVKARGDAEIVANAIDWQGVSELLDVGSGPATYPIVLCKNFSALRATIFDLPATLKLTERYVAQAGLSDRISLIPGDYRNDPIPGNYDVIFLSNIVHGEDFTKNQALIAKLAGNLNAAGRLVIKDHILDDGRANPPVGAIFSLLMLLTTDGGGCYSFNEIKAWLEKAGLRQIHQVDLPSP